MNEFSAECHIILFRGRVIIVNVCAKQNVLMNEWNQQSSFQACQTEKHEHWQRLSGIYHTDSQTDREAGRQAGSEVWHMGAMEIGWDDEIDLERQFRSVRDTKRVCQKVTDKE